MAYQGGAQVKDLAERFGVHRVTITTLLRRQGVTLRKPGLTTDQIAAACRLYRSGWSVSRLGAKLGVDGTTVWRALITAGVIMRSPNERPSRPS